MVFTPFWSAPWAGVSDHPAGRPRTPTAQRLGCIGMIVTTGVDHQGAALDLIELLDARCQHGIVRVAVAIRMERRQIAQVAVFVRAQVLAGLLRVVVPTRGLGGGRLAVLVRRLAAAVLMHMEPMLPGLQGTQLRGEQQTVFGLADLDGANGRLL